LLAGHLAVALGSKRIDPTVSIGANVAAAFALDLLWPLLLLAGVESVEIHPGDTAFTNLAFVSYPWSHSLLTSSLWAGAAVPLGRLAYRSWRAGALLGALVLSHWLLDFVTHRPDLPIWPGGPEGGLSLWNSVPGTILVEGTLLAACTWLYVRVTRPSDATGRWALIALLLLIAAVWVTQPWSPAPPSASAVAWGGLVLWLLPPWASWIERHRVAVSAP
jgi:membrane-bound metal-dependent hydrolase YbcI (DUF457 family)